MPKALGRNFYPAYSIVFQINSDNISSFTQYSVPKKHIHLIYEACWSSTDSSCLQWIGLMHEVLCILITVNAYGSLLQKFNPTGEFLNLTCGAHILYFALH